MKTFTTFAALLILLSAGHPTVVAALRTVALSGTTAPGTSANFTTFNPPVINNAGQTAFFGALNSSSGSFGSNWSEGGGGGLALVARTGTTAPGTSDNFTSFSSPVLNNAGQTAIFGILNSSNATKFGIWSEGGDSALALVARAGNIAPGTSDNFTGFGFPVLNNAGQTAFRGILNSSSGTKSGIWSEGGGSGLALVAREGNNAPGTSDIFKSFHLHVGPVLNNAGQAAFRGGLNSSSAATDGGIWSEGGGGGLALVAREGNTAPGTNVNFTDFDIPVLNNAGQTAFRGGLLSSSANNTGIWSEGGGSGLALVAREGNSAPGTSDIFRSFSKPVLNDAGQTAFRGFLNNNSNTGGGIWSEGGGSGLALVAREGTTAPGTNVNFTDFDTPVLNNAGQTAFRGDLLSAGDYGIWAEDPLGVLTLIVRIGDLLDVDDGPGTDFRTINGLNFFANTGNGDSRGGRSNDLGELAFLASFTDGTRGIFVSDLVAIPEPTSLVLGALGLFGLLATRRLKK